MAKPALRVLRTGGLYFDGRDDYVDLTKSSSGFEEYTLIGRFKTTSIAPDTSHGFRIITVHKAASSTLVSIGLRAANIFFLFYDGTALIFLTVPKVYNDGEYHFLAGSVKNGEQKLYFDGSLVGTWDYPFTTRTTTYTDKIATFDGTYGNFSGLIDEPRIYKRALTDAEISEIYTKGTFIKDGLVLCLPFHEHEGNIAHDVSGYNNHGTIYGANWVVKKALRVLPKAG
ncbi:MAG: LamG domain-containing protein [Candidatus Bathyarchaeia archaeon]